MKRSLLILLCVVMLLPACSPPDGPRDRVMESEEEGESPQAPSVTATPAIPPDPFPEEPPAPTELNVPLRVHNSGAIARSEPVTSGVPLPRELNIINPVSLRLVDANGSPVPAQFTPLARWGAGPAEAGKSIRWLLVDFNADTESGQSAFYYLQEGGPGVQPETPLTISDAGDALLIDTGVGEFRINAADGTLSGPGLRAPISGRVSAGGQSYTTSGQVSVAVKLQGPLRASVHVTGSYRDAGGTALLDYTTRYWFYAGSERVRVFHTVENNTDCPITGEGQIDCYNINSGGSVQFDDLSVIVPAALGGNPVWVTGISDGHVEGQLAADVLLYQDSSGTDYWDTYPTFTGWEGESVDTAPRMQTYVRMRGYELVTEQEVLHSGDHAAGWLTLSSDAGAYTVGVRDFWQNFPKALRLLPDGTLEVGLFPAEFGPSQYAFSLRAGEHKTHEFVLGHYEHNRADLTPLIAQAAPEWVVASGALGFVTMPDMQTWPEHEQFIIDQLDTPQVYYDEGWDHVFPSLPGAIEGMDFYGIFDYGDWPLDYEGFRAAPMNVKYDNDYGAWLQWLRGGDARWFSIAEALDRHTADIDILHNVHEPRHWGDGIAFGHSYHDEDGFLNAHRNYGGNHPDVMYGMQGLLTTYYLTGYEKAFESALEMADSIEYRLHNDENLCGYFNDCSGEGYALNVGLYDSGSRPAANGLNMAVAAYRATGDARYLAVADALVDYAQPSRQPYINGPTGEDMPMKPWQLNMYLRSLANTIEMQAEYGLDSSAARAAYLGYASWLRDYALIELEALNGESRAAYAYEWWFDARQGDPTDEYGVGNNVPSVNNWLLLGADALAYAYQISGEQSYLDAAEALFRAGSHDPWYIDDASHYSESKQVLNSITYGHTFLYVWAQR